MDSRTDLLPELGLVLDVLGGPLAWHLGRPQGPGDEGVSQRHHDARQEEEDDADEDVVTAAGRLVGHGAVEVRVPHVDDWPVVVAPLFRVVLPWNLAEGEEKRIDIFVRDISCLSE